MHVLACFETSKLVFKPVGLTVHARFILFKPLSSAEAPHGYPNKNSSNRKKKARGERWEEGKSVPRALYFSFSQSPLGCDTKRPLQRIEERVFQVTTVFQSGTIAAITKVERFLSR